LPKIQLPISEKEYKEAGSKFVTIPAGDDSVTLAVECGMPDWDTPGVSIKFPVKVIDKGIDAGKSDKISCGVSRDAVWKLKEVAAGFGHPEAVTFVDGKVELDADAFVGTKAAGIWNKTKSNTDPPFYFAKLNSIQLPGTTTETLL